MGLNKKNIKKLKYTYEQALYSIKEFIDLIVLGHLYTRISNIDFLPTYDLVMSITFI